MSRKITDFVTHLGNPLTTHNFELTTTLLDEEIRILVSSTSFPTEKMRDVVLYYLGERIKWPTIPENNGTWNIQIPEGEDGKVFLHMMNKQGLMWNQELGVMKPAVKTTVLVSARALNDEVVFQAKMHGVYLKGPSDIDMNYQDPTTPWRWNWELAYDWIQNYHIRKGYQNPGYEYDNPADANGGEKFTPQTF